MINQEKLKISRQLAYSVFIISSKKDYTEFVLKLYPYLRHSSVILNFNNFLKNYPGPCFIRIGCLFKDSVIIDSWGSIDLYNITDPGYKLEMNLKYWLDIL